jgi:hypothetical protein
MPNEQFFSYIMVRTSYILMMMMYALFLTNTLSWIFIVQTHWNNSPQVEMSFHSGHIILIPNQPVIIITHI